MCILSSPLDFPGAKDKDLTSEFHKGAGTCSGGVVVCLVHTLMVDRPPTAQSLSFTLVNFSP